MSLKVMEYNGLTTNDALQKLKHDGPNEMPEKHESFLKKLFKQLVSPIALMLVLASVLSFFLGKVFDGCFILILFFLNIAITLWQEAKADEAIKKLNEHLEQKITTLRDGKWVEIDSKQLVSGDVIKLTAGDVVPADGKLVAAEHVLINESALTGESLPKDKTVGEQVFSGSFVASGIATVQLSATGAQTKFGKTLFLVERVRGKSALEKDVLSISKFLTFFSLIAVILLSVVLLLRKTSFLELATLDLSLIIAGIPISLPTVMTLIIEFGVVVLAKKDVIIRRLSALEDLANVNFLLTDKTGTLTRNRITIQDIYAYDGFTNNDVLQFAAMVATLESGNPIDSAILEKAASLSLSALPFSKQEFFPADSKRKRSTLFYLQDKNDEVVSVGAPQIIASLCSFTHTSQEKFDRQVSTLAENGYRTLAVACGKGKKEKDLKLVGLIALSDTLRKDAKQVVEFLLSNGVGVSMVTGDNSAIAKQIATELGFADKQIVVKKDLDKLNWQTLTAEFFQKTAAFAEILPEDKFKLVQKAKEFFTVAANGDGINDLPAIKAATVGIAVKNGVTALKATADIVLLSEGISVIQGGVIEGRKIFARLYTYSLYRISESLRLIITIAVLGIIYGNYPMTALQIILIALLNDIPIISLATDNVTIPNRPAKINAKKRFSLSTLYGLTGVLNSLLLFFLVKNVWQLDWSVIQTMYFLKLTVSGHMLIYVAHTKNHWWKFLPSRGVILATSMTQLVATFFALTGFLMSGRLTIWEIFFVWIWAFFWMQISELIKFFQQRVYNKN